MTAGDMRNSVTMKWTKPEKAWTRMLMNTRKKCFRRKSPVTCVPLHHWNYIYRNWIRLPLLFFQQCNPRWVEKGRWHDNMLVGTSTLGKVMSKRSPTQWALYKSLLMSNYSDRSLPCWDCTKRYLFRDRPPQWGVTETLLWRTNWWAECKYV